MARELNTLLLNDANLQGYWRFENNYTDSSGNGNDLSTTSAPEYVALGKFGGCYDFEADDSEFLGIDDASDSDFEFTGSFSIGCWIKAETATSSSLISKDNGTSTDAYVLTIAGDTDVRFIMRESVGGSSAVAHNSIDVSDGEWHLLVGVYNSSTNKKRIYVDSEYTENDQANGLSSYLAHDFNIGARQSGQEQFFDGLIDDAFAFNRALTDNEVASLYGGRPKTVVTI